MLTYNRTASPHISGHILLLAYNFFLYLFKRKRKLICKLFFGRGGGSLAIVRFQRLHEQARESNNPEVEFQLVDLKTVKLSFSEHQLIEFSRDNESYMLLSFYIDSGINNMYILDRIDIESTFLEALILSINISILFIY